MRRLPVNLSMMPMLAEYNRRRLLDVIARMADPERTPWVHLLDGGISDNLALRATLNFTLLGGTEQPDAARLLMPVRRFLMISVDGQSSTDQALSRQRMVNGVIQIFDAVSGGQIDNYNLETLAVAAAEVNRLVERSARGDAARPGSSKATPATMSKACWCMSRWPTCRTRPCGTDCRRSRPACPCRRRRWTCWSARGRR